ncbi:hypothetical protein [Devosia sp.]|uniref:hypothetical protein n=1 Tax=Devosia sp. TaxID=1871048 RepID=UPI001B15E73C|nr:hypothetical protein [Devosia sp.]MBO9588518.1 hypothetical protein [Devosia sp.]
MRLRLAPEWECWPLWDHETGDNLDPRDLKLPPALLARLVAWDDVFQATFNRDDPLASVLPGEDWQAEGRALAEALKTAGFKVIASL